MSISRGIHKALANRPDLTPETVRSIFDYDATTGILRWRIHGGKTLPGSRAGGPDDTGRWRVGYKGKDYLVSRVIWLWACGKWPEHDVDHIDLNCSNDKLVNLRDIPHSMNMANTRARQKNNTGTKGVHYDTRRGKYKATIMKNYRTHNLGRFDTLAEAKAAYEAAAVTLFGEAART